MPEERHARVAFVTLGCKVNQTESEAIAATLGVSCSAAEAAEADIVVVNTCTVTAEADHKARKAVRHALGLPGAPVVVVTGCLASLDAESLQGLGGRVVVEADKARVAERVRAALGERAVARGETRTHTRVQLKVEDGCDQFCTYCIVPRARGVPRAVPIDEVVAEATRLASAGVPEVVLTGINIGRYEDAGRGLPGLLAAVAGTGVPRLRVSSIEPGDVSELLLATAASLPAFCPHLHVPLQSGSDRVLRRMGRPYDTAAFADAVRRARLALPGLALSTDVIVGFPGETDAEFAETLAFVESMAFSRLHVFRYSPRPGTPAADMPDQVAAPVKAARSAALRDLAARLAAGYVALHSDEEAELLVERVVADASGAAVADGTTREYIRATVTVPADTMPGTLLRVRLGPAGPGEQVRAVLAE